MSRNKKFKYALIAIAIIAAAFMIGFGVSLYKVNIDGVISTSVLSGVFSILFMTGIIMKSRYDRADN